MQVLSVRVYDLLTARGDIGAAAQVLVRALILAVRMFETVPVSLEKG